MREKGISVNLYTYNAGKLSWAAFGVYRILTLVLCVFSGHLIMFIPSFCLNLSFIHFLCIICYAIFVENSDYCTSKVIEKQAFVDRYVVDA